MVWEYNQHEDFVPYYDSMRGRWAVSIQYLDVWYFKTEQEAINSVPILKEYRKKVLNWVEEQNKKYFHSIAEKQGLLKKKLKAARKKEKEIEVKLCGQLNKIQKTRLENMLDSGFTDEEIMEVLPISKRAVALKRWHRYKGGEDGSNQGTVA